MLVTSDNGGAVFGYITIGMTIINFLITPYIGTLVDRMSRKRLLIGSELACFLVLLPFTALGFLGVSYETWHYTVIYVIGSLSYTLFYPTMFAMNQELFTKEQYKTLNGTMEVQSQLSSMIAGGVASILMLKWEIHYILLLNILTYIAAIYFYLKLPYARAERTEGKNSFNRKTSEGLLYMLARPAMFAFLLFSFMPFIGVMLTNYLFPVYLSDVLQTDANVYGILGMIYAVGAVVAGLLIPAVAKKLGNEKTMILGVLVYSIAISIVVFVELPIYLVLMFFLALGNSSARVARNSFLMDKIPNDIIGRVDSLFRTIGLLQRIILLAIFTGMVSSELIVPCFYILSTVLLVATIIVSFSWNKGFREEERLLQVKRS